MTNLISHLKNFTGVHDQLSYFVKTVNITKGSFIPRKMFFINFRNHIKLDKTTTSTLRKMQRLWKQYLKMKDTKTCTDFRKTSNQLKYLTKKYVKEKGEISVTKPKLTQNVFGSM